MTTVSGKVCLMSQSDLVAEITIDGDTAISFTENVEMRFKSYGWNVLHVENGNE